MASEEAERRLAAILSADAVGYTRLMAEDEDGTVRRLTAYRDEMGLLIQQHRGRVVDSPGDNLLAEFPAATDAVTCAVEIQGVLGIRNATLPHDRKMEFRIGVHLGEVRVEGDRIYGDGVNIAARLQTLAETGGICISGEVHGQVRRKLEFEYEDLGEQRLKNVPEPIRVHRIRLKAEGASAPGELRGMQELTAPGFSGRPAMAVLPFDNLSGDPEQEYFADGIAEDLITRLSSWRWFPVIARNSSFVYKGKAVDVKQVSRELGVLYVVEGSVRKAGDQVRLSAQLVNAMTGHHIWAETYDRELGDIFALQDEITEAIVGSMYPELQRFEADRVMRQEPQNLNAWDCTQRGMWHLNRLTKEDNAQAELLFKQAIELDPQFARAFSGLALVYYWNLFYLWTDQPVESIAELVRVAQKAVALDDKDPSSHLASALAAHHTGQQDKMIAACELATRLDPSLARAHGTFGVFLALVRRSEDALAELETAMRLSPQGPDMYMFLHGMALAHLAAGRLEEAVRWDQQSLQRRPDYGVAHMILAVAYAQLGRMDEARSAVEHALRLVPGLSVANLELQFSASDPALAEFVIDGLRKAGLPE